MAYFEADEATASNLSRSIFQEPTDETEDNSPQKKYAFTQSLIKAESALQHEPLEDAPVVPPISAEEAHRIDAAFNARVAELQSSYIQSLTPYTTLVLAIQDAMYLNNKLYSAVYLAILHGIWLFLVFYPFPPILMLILRVAALYLFVDAFQVLAKRHNMNLDLQHLNVRYTGSPRSLHAICAIIATVHAKTASKYNSFNELRSHASNKAALLVGFVCIMIDSIVKIFGFGLVSYALLAAFILAPILEKNPSLNHSTSAILKNVRELLHVLWAKISATPKKYIKVEAQPEALVRRRDRDVARRMSAAAQLDTKELDHQIAEFHKEEVIAPIVDDAAHAVAAPHFDMLSTIAAVATHVPIVVESMPAVTQLSSDDDDIHFADETINEFKVMKSKYAASTSIKTSTSSLHSEGLRQRRVPSDDLDEDGFVHVSVNDAHEL